MDLRRTKKDSARIIKLQEDSNQKRVFREVYEKYFDRLFAYACVITNCESLAKDAVSEVFFNLWNSGRELSAIRELKAYLFTSVKHQAIRAVSADPAHFESFSYDQLTRSIEHVSPEDLMIGKELEDFLEEAVNALPPHCRLVYKMVKEQNMKHREVAAELGISQGTVKQHMIAALAKIKDSLNEHFKEASVLELASYLINLVLMSCLMLTIL